MDVAFHPALAQPGGHGLQPQAGVAMLATGSCLSLLAIMLLMQGIIMEKERLVMLWLYWGAAELFLKIINLFGDLTDPLNHLAWIYQVCIVLIHDSFITFLL